MRISKFGSGLAVLRPELPATPWNRVLSKHLGPVSRPTTAPHR
ncbi:hypothetical protein [Paraoerskovia sediminicola]|nr:hypothetical protein [Paraoerskovia sediminicola]